MYVIKVNRPTKTYTLRRVNRQITVSRVGKPGSPGADGPAGPSGADGDSAYQVWLDEGNTGTEQDFIDSLKGDTGNQGPPGNDGLIQSVVAGDNITVDDTDPANPIVSAEVSSAVDSVNGQTGVVVLDQDDVGDGTTYKRYSQTEKTKLAGIEAGAEVNNISDANATDLTDGGASTLHYHASDRDRANHTGSQAISTVTGLQTALDGKAAASHTHTASQVTDFDTEVSNNTDVAANTAARHTHSNKALLDTYTQTEANLADAVAKKHTHSNQTVLDNTTASFTTADETKLDGIEAGADVTDATNVAAAGAFMKSADDTDDISEGSTNKFATAAEKTKLGHITVTQAVDLDTMESDIAGKQPLDSDLTAIAGLSPTNDDVIQRKAGAWTNRSMAQVKTDLALTKGDVGLGNVDNTSNATERAATATLTNKRITRRVATTNAPGATPTTNTDNVDVQTFTGLATDITSMTTNLSGTPVDGDLLEFRFLDNGTARAITWGSSFTSSGTVTLPTTTVTSTVLRVGFEYSTVNSINKWICIAKA